MNAMTITVTALLSAGLLWLAWVFNRLVSLRNRCRNAWSQIEVQLERRSELVVKLAAAVREYAAHEKGLFEKITKRRTEALSAGAPEARADAEGRFSGDIKNLIAVSEAYPGLKADGNFLSLMDELTDIEDRIRFSRQFYNDTVMLYNTAVSTFPERLVAGLFSFEEAQYFEIGG